ncbi:MAG: hypothetical protein ACJAZ3_001610 [Sphingobacteriales bacterium]|jgi:hypothetical protein
MEKQKQCMAKIGLKIGILLFISIATTQISAQDIKRTIFIPGVISAYQVVETPKRQFVVFGNSYDSQNSEKFAFSTILDKNGTLLKRKHFSDLLY